jgi:hypothetical protein
MATITFDTLKFARRLTDAGVPIAQAEAEASALSEVLEVNLKEIATKQDMLDFERRLENRFELIESRLTIKLGAFIALAVGILVAVLKFPV